MDQIIHVIESILGTLKYIGLFNIIILIILILAIINTIFSIWHKRAITKTQDIITRHEKLIMSLKLEKEKDQASKHLRKNLREYQNCYQDKMSNPKERQRIFDEFNYSFIKYINSGNKIFRNEKDNKLTKKDDIEIIEDIVFNAFHIINKVLSKCCTEEYKNFYGDDLSISNRKLYSEMIDFVYEHGKSEHKEKLKSYKNLIN
jgi:hypothetical protein